MNDVLLDLFRHNAWANRTVLEYCRGLSDEALAATDAAVYGNILATMQHVLGGESLYAGMFLGRFQPWDFSDAPTPSADEMLVWTADMASAWDEVLSRPVDPDAVLGRKREGRPDRK